MAPIIHVCRYAEHARQIRAVRRAVFVEEQNVPADLEFDGRDEQCLHVLAVVNGCAVGTGRLDVQAGGKIGRLAVLPPYRRQGLGAAMMAELENLARQAGLDAVYLHAQESALAFYRRLGYRAVGRRFFEAGIVHRKMIRNLT